VVEFELKEMEPSERSLGSRSDLVAVIEPHLVLLKVSYN
jgi:hypothetical protein